MFLTFGKVCLPSKYKSRVLNCFRSQLSKEKYVKMIKTLENDLAIMMGMFQNTSFFSRTFPGTWKFFVRYVSVFCNVLAKSLEG